MELAIPELSLVALVGVSGSGKSTFARKHFAPTEVLSSDAFRGLVADDEHDQSATTDAFDGLFHIAGIRLRNRRLTVIDATHTQPEARQRLLTLAREHHVLPVAIVLDLPAKLCLERNSTRPDRSFGKHVIPQQASQLRRSLRGLRREGFRHVFVLRSPEEIESATVRRVRLWTDRRDDAGPFDIIGDVHGCFDELQRLLQELGYRIDAQGGNGSPRFVVAPPPGRKAVFLGDLVDRGPRVVDVLRLVIDMVASGAALCVPGNHEVKLLRKLNGADVRVSHGLQQTLEQLAAAPPSFTQEVRDFIDRLVSHYVLDDGRLVVAHAGLKQDLQGRASGVVRSFALYGDTTGEIDEFGLPVRHEWAREYRGKAIVVYGHTPTPEAEWLNRTICIDTGCVFGGKLTALRYPEQELVGVPAAQVYCEPVRPLAPPLPADGRTAQQTHDDLLYREDVAGPRIVSTRLRPNISIREANSIAALEVMSRFAIDPRWLVYLPPTMSPSETSQHDGHLEHPAEAFGYFRRVGVERVVCQRKHMGSRAVLIVCKDEATPLRRFGIEGNGVGVCYTRTGRAFFQDAGLERALLLRVRDAVAAAGLWDELATDWLCLDCELMPWSAKAQALLVEQYAPAGAAGTAALTGAIETLERAGARGIDVAEVLDRTRTRLAMVGSYVDAYREYCWPVSGLDDYRLAPFHLLASEQQVHVDRDHVWHLQTLARICAADQQLLVATPYLVVDVAAEQSEAQAVAWWEELTAAGGEGMVVKPLAFVARGRKGLVQPALKCRGREYLRIIYGPEYLVPEHLARLRTRALAGKRSLALREFALGIEGLERFVRREPLRRVHECVFGVLALESEPVDPRL